MDTAKLRDRAEDMARAAVAESGVACSCGARPHAPDCALILAEEDAWLEALDVLYEEEHFAPHEL